ncbi:MAG TPA: hypothetical protein DEH11_22470 [Actinobacteria bacterium]|nr:hypothetical protein [Actinomycetota bacterium]
MLKISNGGCYRPIDSPAVQVATERHSRKLPPAVDAAATALPRYAFSVLRVGVVPVRAGPGDQGAAGGAARGYLRASHADREDVIDVLKAAFVQGRLTRAELDGRVGQAFASRTYGDLAAITADLPAGLIGAQLPRKPASAQALPPVNKRLLWTAGAILLAAIASVVAGFLAQSLGLLSVGMLGILIAAPIAGTLMLDSWRENRSGGQLPPRPAQFGQALEGERDDGPGNDLILCQAHRDTGARRLLAHSVTQRIWRSVPTRGAGAGLCT